MAIKLCHHIKENGIWCGSAALHGRDYCFFHLTFRGRRMRIAQHRKAQKVWRLELPPLEDLNAVQVAIMQVLDAITEDRIERHDAGHLLYGLQTAASNLRGKEGRASFEVEPTAENRCVSYDSFEEDLGLTDDETTADGAAAPGVKPTLSPTEGDQGGAPPATAKKTATEAAGEEPPSPIVIDRLMAFADEGPYDTPANPKPAAAAVREAPRKPPRALRPPRAERQSAEEATALEQEWRRAGEECGQLEDGAIVKCKACEGRVYKQLAQFWEGDNQPADWLPVSGIIDCRDCRSRRRAALHKQRAWMLSFQFRLYLILKKDGGEDPGDFGDFFHKLGESAYATGRLPEDWSKRYHCAEQEGFDLAEEGEEEETEASA